jgi:hypothetical protein
MFRLLVTLAALVTVVPFADAAPGPKRDDRTAWYFPTMVGDKLTYAVTYRDLDGAVVMEKVRTRTVTAVKQTDGGAVVTN